LVIDNQTVGILVPIKTGKAPVGKFRAGEEIH
jgi:hypothetical protein